MSPSQRRLLRSVGVVLLVLGVTALVLLIEPGPQKVSDWMGRSCATDRHSGPGDCDTLDAVDVL